MIEVLRQLLKSKNVPESLHLEYKNGANKLCTNFEKKKKNMSNLVRIDEKNDIDAPAHKHSSIIIIIVVNSFAVGEGGGRLNENVMQSITAESRERTHTIFHLILG